MPLFMQITTFILHIKHDMQFRTILYFSAHNRFSQWNFDNNIDAILQIYCSLEFFHKTNSFFEYLLFYVIWFIIRHFMDLKYT